MRMQGIQVRWYDQVSVLFGNPNMPLLLQGLRLISNSRIGRLGKSVIRLAGSDTPLSTSPWVGYTPSHSFPFHDNCVEYCLFWRRKKEWIRSYFEDDNKKTSEPVDARSGVYSV